MISNQTSLSQIQARITDEIFFAFGLNRTGILRSLFGWLFYWPTKRFAHIFAMADEIVKEGGLPAGSRFVLKKLAIEVFARGTETIPEKGPLIIIANHPGAHDALAIAACLPRSDLKILVAETNFYHSLRHAQKYLIFVPSEIERRMLSLRQAIHRLKEGDALLQFATGTIDGDPSLENTEEWLPKWSPSLEIMLRQVPEAKIILVAASHVLLRRFFHHPIVRLYRHPVKRRRLAGFLQVIQQLLWPKSVKAQAKLSFSQPFLASDLLTNAQSGSIMKILAEQAHRHLQDHLAFN